MSDTHDPALLAAGYALGTLTDEEQAMYEAHLASSRAARREARGFGDVVDVLAGADALTPPPELKARIMAQLATTPQLNLDAERDGVQGAAEPSDARGQQPAHRAGTAEPAESAGVAVAAAGKADAATAGARMADIETAGVAAAAERTAGAGTAGGGTAELAGAGPAETRARARWFRQPVAVLVAAAAAAALFVGGTAVGVAVGNANTAPTQQASAVAQITAASDAQRASAKMADGGSATLIWSLSLEKSALVVKGAKPAPAGKTYQLWYIRNGTATSAGLVSDQGTSGDWQVLAGRMQSGDSVGLTLEPAGGSKQPTTKPVVVVPT